MRLTLKPLLYPQASSPHRIKFLHSPSVAPLFSWSYNLLFSQPLSFDEHLRCPPGVGSALHSEFSFPSASAATRLFSTAYRLLDSLASLFRVPLLCFQQLADSFCKMRGGWGTSLGFTRFRRSDSRCPDLQIVYADPNLRTCQPSATVLKSTRRHYEHT